MTSSVNPLLNVGKDVVAMVFLPASYTNVSLISVTNHTFIITDSRAEFTNLNTGFFSASLMGYCLNKLSNPETSSIARSFESRESMVSSDVFVSIRNVSLDSYKE
jgi:hypothetical protein